MPATKEAADLPTDFLKPHQVRLSTEVTRIIKRDSTGVKVAIRQRRAQKDHHNPGGETDPPVDTDMPETVEEYDELVLCCLAKTADRLLGAQARWIEKRVLRATKWSDDITVTHTVRPACCAEPAPSVPSLTTFALSPA
jgi:hypothetical protein